MLNENTDRLTEKLTKFKKINCWWDDEYKILRRTRYYRSSDDNIARHGRKYPNWKLVSKNRKQWMKKPLKLQFHHHNPWNGRDTWELVW